MIDEKKIIQEFKKSLWHDASEEPEKFKNFLFIKDNGAFNIWCVPCDDWEKISKAIKIARWCYIDDILPKEGGEQC